MQYKRSFQLFQKRIEKAKCEVPSLNNYSDDLCTLTQPNAATVLHALNIRYTSNVIHVSLISGEFLFQVVGNYLKFLLLQ